VLSCAPKKDRYTFIKDEIYPSRLREKKARALLIAESVHNGIDWSKEAV